MSEMGHKRRKLEDIVRIETQSIIDSVGFHSATGLKAINVAALHGDIAKSLARLTEWILHELQKAKPPELAPRTAENGLVTGTNGPNSGVAAWQNGALTDRDGGGGKGDFNRRSFGG